MYEGTPKSGGNFRYLGRRRALEMSDNERAADAARSRSMIDEHIASKGVTICKPGFAVGARPTQYEPL